MNLTSGGKKIITGGDVFLFEQSNELTINISDAADFNICVTMKFLTDDSGEHRITRDICEDSLVLSCYNFGGEGTGLSRPAHIADVADKKVYLMFWTYEEGIKEPKVRSVKYTIFYDT